MSIETPKDPGRLIPTEYGWGQIVPAATVARKPPRVDPPLTEDDIRKKYGLSPAQFLWVCAHESFPKPTANHVDISVVGFPRSQTVRSAEKVAEFFSTARQIFGGR